MDSIGDVSTPVNQGETLAKMLHDIKLGGLQPTHFLICYFRWNCDKKKN